MMKSSVREATAERLHEALAATPCLRWQSPQRDQLWLVAQASICTRGRVLASPMGSTTPQQIGGDDARADELLAAMMWLTHHEHQARAMSANELYRRLRGVAVRGKHGSARASQSDALHGMTQVRPGRPVSFKAEGAA
jgi:hypothetical protein